MRYQTFFRLSIILLVALFLIYYYYFWQYSINCDQNTQFSIDKKNLLGNNKGLTENNIYYIKENFSSYGDIYSMLINRMDDINGTTLFGKAKNLKLSDSKYGEYDTVSFTISPDIKDDTHFVTVRKNLTQPINISRRNNIGYFTSWLKLENRKGIQGVSLKIGDNNGNYRLYNELPNLQLDAPVLIKVAGPYPDIYFPNKGEGVDKWQNFRLVNGWNYLFWRSDKGYFNDSGNIDMRNISWFEIIFYLNDTFSMQNINMADVRVQDGLQKTLNPTNGNWYAPNGAPQYGVFDVDEIANDTTKNSKNYKLMLLNVRQEQYPSNGDHARILSKRPMPLNFTMQIYFKLIDLPEKYEGNLFNHTSLRKNTYFRVQYDFDNVYDPGHDWFGTFISLEYDKLGLVSTYPIVRYFKQGQEPVVFTNDNRVTFQPEDNIMYILDIKVLGQYENAIIYEVDKNCIKNIGDVEYTFKRHRYGLDKRYPLSIEATGEVHTDIYSVDVISLDNIHDNIPYNMSDN